MSDFYSNYLNFQSEIGECSSMNGNLFSHVRTVLGKHNLLMVQTIEHGDLVTKIAGADDSVVSRMPIGDDIDKARRVSLLVMIGSNVTQHEPHHVLPLNPPVSEPEPEKQSEPEQPPAPPPAPQTTQKPDREFASGDELMVLIRDKQTQLHKKGKISESDAIEVPLEEYIISSDIGLVPAEWTKEEIQKVYAEAKRLIGGVK